MSIAIFIIVGWGILFAVHLLVFSSLSRVFELSVPYWPLWLGLLSASYLLANIGVRKFHSLAADWFYFAAATWLGIIFLLFSVILIYELVHLAAGFDSGLVLGGLIFATLALSFYAVVQGRELIVKEYTVPIDGLVRPLRLVQLSDIHVGTVHQEKFLNRIVEATNALKPDLVLITGDLFDGSAPIDEEMLKPLDELAAPSFFSNGNHEQYEGLVAVRETLKNSQVIQLENAVTTQSGLQIIGVNDRQSLPPGESLGAILDSLTLDTSLPTVLMYHTPAEWEEARAHGVDLMLSGHTHNGQIFPFTLLVRMFFRYINGLYEEEGKYLHVSPGTGTWGPPMRLGSKNQITILLLVPKT